MPVTEGQRVVERIAIRAAPPGLAAAQVVVEAGVEQIVEREQVVQRQRHVALIFASGLAARVIHRQAHTGRKLLAPLDHHITFAGFGIRRTGRRDLNVGLSGRHALEVLQCLLDVTQVEQIAGVGRHRIPQVGTAAGAFRKTNLANAPRHYRQHQNPAVQILSFGEDTSGDVARLDNRVLHTLHRHVDARATQATAHGRIILGVGSLQRPLKFLGCLANQANVIDGKARRLFCRQTRATLIQRWCLKTHIGPRFQLITQRPLTFLLAQQLFFRPGRLGRSGHQECAHCQRRQREVSGIQ